MIMKRQSPMPIAFKRLKVGIEHGWLSSECVGMRPITLVVCPSVLGPVAMLCWAQFCTGMCEYIPGWFSTVQNVDVQNGV